MMPEGPEVRTVVDQLQGAVGMVFRGVQFLSGRYVRHGPPDGYEDFIQTLNLTNEPTDIVQEWNAKGKFIYMILNDGSNPPYDDFQRSIWFTLGMSGRFVAASMNHLQSTEPRWVMQLERRVGGADSSCPIFYHDPRNFGTLKFSLSSAALHDKLKSLGPDILNVETTTEDLFVELVTAQKPELNVCKFLMNQKKVSGVGNYILAEGLYRAMIDPFCSLGEISTDQQRSLLRELQSTALQSYHVQGLTRPGGSYRDAEGNKGRFEFQLQCYGRAFCVIGKPVKKEIEGPHGRTIWYTEDQLFMPRTARRDCIDNIDIDERKAIDSLDSNAVRDAAPSLVTRGALPERMVVKAMDASVLTTPSATAILRQPTSLNATSTAPKTITTTVDPVGRLEAGLTDVGWRKALAGVLHSEQFRELENFIHDERSQGIIVYPPEDEVFAALNLCPLDSVKVVIVGQDPYHGPGQGHGLSFSVRPGVRPPPSLQNIFKEAQADVGIDLPRSGHLTCWAKQGVLLLNTVLTVRAGEANSHAKMGWEQFTDAIIKTLSDDKEGIVFLLWGRPAQLKASCVDETRHAMIRTSHPSPLGASKTSAPFLGSRCFSRTNSALEAAGIDPIDWSVRES